MNPKIVVIGSANTDRVIKVDHLPNPGETILGHGFAKMLGGKGANQAVAAARLGAEVTFIGRLGKDLDGKEAVEAYQYEGINTDFITWDDDEPSGAALIMVNPKGENIIAVAPGANWRLSPEDIVLAEDPIKAADCVVLQLEIPLESVEAGIRLANKHGVMVILNPAPAAKLPLELLKLVDVLTPNQTEAEILIENYYYKGIRDISQLMGEYGLVKNLVITCGCKGAMIPYSKKVFIPSFEVDAIDATGAGDAFNGGLAVALAKGKDFEAAIQFANAVGALTTTKIGAQSAMPTASEIDAFMANIRYIEN